MEQDITCKKEKELFFSYLGSLGLGVLLLLLIAFLYFYNNDLEKISDFLQIFRCINADAFVFGDTNFDFVTII